jgi:hypothetical protein
MNQSHQHFSPQSASCRRFFLALLLGIGIAFLAGTLSTGCVAVMGTTEQARKTTIGQELIDLKKALDAGVITEAEYEAQKAKLLGGKPK